MFGIGAGATIKGTFADEDWEGVPERVKTALNAAFAEGNLMDKGRFRNLFGDNDVTIIMEKTTEYNHYKVVDGEFTTLYLNIASPLSVDDITAAVTAARNEEAAMAKVPPKGMGNDMKPAIYAAYGAVAGNAAYHLTA
uniref:Uncharacterized protein n=1 Tax=uncultured bacterium contig00015 TaxID=1181506 RepID=A0A806KI37_9BACT|nr:hypothetical protein [uncultured bacterium contig00015]